MRPSSSPRCRCRLQLRQLHVHKVLLLLLLLLLEGEKVAWRNARAPTVDKLLLRLLLHIKGARVLLLELLLLLLVRNQRLKLRV